MKIAFLLYEGMTALDAIGPHEVLSRLPGAEVSRLALSSGWIKSESSGLTLIAEQSLSECPSADLLVVPGAKSATTLEESPETLEWIRMIHKGATWTASVCTGSLILGAAGLLSGLQATTHWAMMDRLSRWGALPTKERVVESGKIVTAAGVSAGIDMALTLAAKIAGPEVAQALQLGIEYEPKPPFDCGSPERASPELVKRLRSQFEEAAAR